MKEEFYISLVGEAFDGYTEALFNDSYIYIKHISIRDQRYLHKYYEKYKELALSRGLELEKDRISYVLEEEIWDAESDLKIASLEKEVENLKISVKHLNLRSQREQLEKNKILNYMFLLLVWQGALLLKNNTLITEKLTTKYIFMQLVV